MEEATRMCRDKMIRLRSLYITQFKRLQHVLRERRRKYCQAIQAEEIEDTGYQTTVRCFFKVIKMPHIPVKFQSGQYSFWGIVC